MSVSYLVRRFEGEDPAQGNWNDRVWKIANVLDVSHFHAKGADHQPHTQARLLYDAQNIYLRFDVDDRYVLSRHTKYQDSVCLDSCVEFFFSPSAGLGYLDIEINCGGTLLFYYVEDHRRAPGGFVKFTRVPAEDGAKLAIYHSMPQVVDPERTEPKSWRIGCQIPLKVIEKFAGSIGDPAGQIWRGNFFKCADRCSHPHWASWAPLGEALDFHQPKYFQQIHFEKW
jgi:hypothetical protein